MFTLHLYINDKMKYFVIIYVQFNFLTIKLIFGIFFSFKKGGHFSISLPTRVFFFFGGGGGLYRQCGRDKDAFDDIYFLRPRSLLKLKLYLSYMYSKIIQMRVNIVYI